PERADAAAVRGGARRVGRRGRLPGRGALGLLLHRRAGRRDLLTGLLGQAAEGSGGLADAQCSGCGHGRADSHPARNCRSISTAHGKGAYLTRRRAMKLVTSADGTVIAYQQQGSGPALIIVDGAMSTRGGKAALRALLAPQLTVFGYDRRGRGDSGDTLPYAVEREIEDIQALIE